MNLLKSLTECKIDGIGVIPILIMILFGSFVLVFGVLPFVDEFVSGGFNVEQPEVRSELDVLEDILKELKSK